MKKKFIGKFHNYSVYFVDPFEIRNSDTEFGNWGINKDFSYIPKNELWISDKTEPKEIKFYLLEAYLYGTKGKKYQEAIKASKDERSSDNTTNLKIELFTIIGGILVWIVNGRAVRDLYKTDFIEGGHGEVYSWIPKNEIWIEKEIPKKERSIILLHEYTERFLMLEGMNYDTAHKLASKIEASHRKILFPTPIPP